MADLEFDSLEEAVWLQGYDSAINDGSPPMPGEYKADWRAVFWSFGFAAGQEESNA